MSNYCVVDIETGTIAKYGRKAHFKYNQIIAICFKHQGQEAKVYYKEEDWEEVIYNELKNTKVMVAFNAKFECLHFWKYNKFQQLLKDGLRIYCGQLAEFMLSGQRHQYPALRDIAVNKYGCLEREKFMEQYWNNEGNWFTLDGYILPKEEEEKYKKVIFNGRGACHSYEIEEGRSKYGVENNIVYKKGLIDTGDIPKDLVINDVKSDVEDTEVVMLAQIKEAKRIGMFTLIDALMDSLLATASMEFNGLYLDQEIRDRNKLQLEKDIKAKEEEILKLCERYWK